VPSNFTGDPTAAEAPSPAPSLAEYPIVQQPADGDDVDAASVAQAPQTLANNVAYILDRLRDMYFGTGVDGALSITGSSTVNMTGMQYFTTVSVTSGVLNTNGWPVIARDSITVNGQTIAAKGSNATSTTPGGAVGGGAVGPHMDVCGYGNPTAVEPAISTKSIYGLGGAGGEGGGTATTTPTVLSPGNSIYVYPYRFHGGSDFGQTLSSTGGLNVPQYGHYDTIRGGSSGLPGDVDDGACGPAGAGGGLIVPMAPVINLLGFCVLNASGSNGSGNGQANGNGGGGGGGGAFLFVCQTLNINSTPSYLANAGTGGLGTGAGSAGAAGTAGNTTPYVVYIP